MRYSILIDSGGTLAGTLHGRTLLVPGFDSTGTVLDSGDVRFDDGCVWTKEAGAFSQAKKESGAKAEAGASCLLYTSPSPRDS